MAGRSGLSYPKVVSECLGCSQKPSGSIGDENHPGERPRVILIGEKWIMTKGAKDRRLMRLTKICLAFPEASRQVYGQHAQFLIRTKTFAYFLNDHHGDGIVAVTGKVLPGDNSALVAAQPKRFYLPAYLAHRGW